MKPCNCHPPMPPKYTPGPVQTSASTLYPSVMPRPVIIPDAPHLPDVPPIPMQGPMPAPGPAVPVIPPDCKRKPCPPPKPRPPRPPCPPCPPGPPIHPPHPPVPVPEPCDVSSKFKEVVVDGVGDVKVDKIDEVYRTVYLVSFDGFEKRYELEPYTKEEISAMFDQIDNGVADE